MMWQFLFFSLIFVHSCYCTTKKKVGKAPNIIFILADDMGYGDAEPYSVYPQKNSHYKLLTPNLVTMANEGMLFTDSYCGAPVCAPSRCTLMTGQHSGHCDVRENGQYLHKSTITIASILSNNSVENYDTALFGKWGLGYINSSDLNDPVSKGFGTYIGQVDQNMCHDYYPPYQWYQQIQTFIVENSNASREVCGEPDYDKCLWTGDIWTNATINYLKSNQRKSSNKPFYIFLSYTTPHSGNIGNNEENDVPIPRVTQSPYWKFNNSWNRIEIDYATAITDIDIFIGEIFKTLKEEELDNNTIVFFASDNGASNEGGQNYEFFASSGPLSGYKRSLKEGGHRTAFIVRWPGMIEAGTRSDYQWAFYDFMATAADLAGIDNSTLPANDGTSLLPILLGESKPQKNWVYHEYCQPNENPKGWGQALRIGNYTGLCIGDQPQSEKDIPVCNSTTFELYDLTNDIEQTNDISSNNQAMVQQMLTIMKEQHSTGQYCGAAIDQ